LEKWINLSTKLAQAEYRPAWAKVPRYRILRRVVKATSLQTRPLEEATIGSKHPLEEVLPVRVALASDGFLLF
jgi:hypothetical protein